MASFHQRLDIQNPDVMPVILSKKRKLLAVKVLFSTLVGIAMIADLAALFFNQLLLGVCTIK